MRWLLPYPPGAQCCWDPLREWVENAAELHHPGLGKLDIHPPFPSLWVKIASGIINFPASSHPPPKAWPSRLLMGVRKPLVPTGTTHVTAEAVGAFGMGWGIWVGVWVACHRITNWHTFKSLEQLTFIILQFPCVRSPDMAWLGLLLRISQGCGPGVVRLHSPLGTNWRRISF